MDTSVIAHDLSVYYGLRKKIAVFRDGHFCGGQRVKHVETGALGYVVRPPENGRDLDVTIVLVKFDNNLGPIFLSIDSLSAELQ